MPASGQQRDTSRDGLRNKVEAALLSGLQPFWAFVNKTPWLARIFNGLIVNNAVLKAPLRPLALSTQAPYTSWATLSDRTWFSRYLPPAPQDQLPPVPEVATTCTTACCGIWGCSWWGGSPRCRTASSSSPTT